MEIAYGALLIVAWVFLGSCSGTSEAKTRKDQEVEFRNAFGFTPPSSITAINYSDLYNRGVIDGAYAQWLSFTFEQASFDKIMLGGYTEEQSRIVPNSNAAPAWWPKTVPTGSVIFSRSQDDTPKNEGFSFREYIWHDDASGMVFFHKSYWD